MDFRTYQNLINKNKHQAEENVVARFYDRTIKTADIDERGLPIFKTICYCEIRIKDNTTEVFDQPASKDKIERFPLEYARYQLSKKQVETGTLLEQFAFLTLSEIERCKHRGIFTVEALADLSDEHANELGLETEVKAARIFVENGAKLKSVIEAEEIRQKYCKKIAELEKQIKELSVAKTRRKSK